MQRFISSLCSSLLLLAVLVGTARADVQECVAGQDCRLVYSPFSKTDSSKVTDLSEATADFLYYWNDADTTATAISESAPDNINVYQKGASSGNYVLLIPSSANIVTSANAGKTFCVYASGHSTIDTNKPACVYVKTKTDENTVARMPSSGTLSTLTVNSVWDEPQSSHTTAGTFGYYLDAQVSAAGGGGSADWSTTERNQIRYRLGIDGTTATPAATPTLGDIGITQAGADKVWNTTSRTITGGTVTTVNDKTGYSLSAAGVDAILDDTVEGSLTMRQMVKIMAAALAGKASGGGTTTITFTGLDGTTTRITATVDASGNRTAVTVNGN